MSKKYLRTTPVHKRSHETITKILDAAEATFLEIGYDKTTTRMIAERAAVPFGSLYYFFPNKQAVLDGLAARHMQAQSKMHKSTSHLSPIDDLDGFLDVMVEKIAAHYYEHAPFERIIYAPSSSPEIEMYVRRFNEEILNRAYQNMVPFFSAIKPAELRVQAEQSLALARSLLSVAAGHKDKTIRSHIKQNTKAALKALWAPMVDKQKQSL